MYLQIKEIKFDFFHYVVHVVWWFVVFSVFVVILFTSFFLFQ